MHEGIELMITLLLLNSAIQPLSDGGPLFRINQLLSLSLPSFTPDITIARASSSTSSKLSCFTALIEYSHTPTANELIASPVIAFFTLYGSRARSSPWDICGAVHDE